jgi:Retrotransposon gag protein
LIPTEVTSEQVAQIAAIFNINTAQATNITSTHTLTLNLFTTQTQTRTRTHTSTGATPGYGGRGGGGGGGGPGGTLGGLAQILIAIGGSSLMGQSPGIYEGDHAKSKVFMEKFEIWRWLNHGHPAMANPSNRIMMFCMHLIGPKVDGWACGRVNELRRSIMAGNVNPDTEILWTEFRDRFHKDFQDTAVKKDALHKLMNLCMQGDDLNTYTMTFNDIMSLAGFEKDTLRTIIAYRRGLKKALHNMILNKQWPYPQMMVKWQTAARHHNTAWVEK